MNPGGLIFLSAGTLIGGVLLLICVTDLIRNSILRRGYWQQVSGDKTQAGKQRQDSSGGGES